MRTMESIGELAAIRRIVKSLPSRADVRVGPGDDCAVVTMRRGEDLLLKSDPVVAGVHFLASHRPEAIGHKALGRVLSDFAAMGGEPRWALFNVVAPAKTPASTLDGIYRGISKLARRYGVAVVGGDVTRGPVLELHAFAAGTVPRRQAVLRSGARRDDVLFVTGTLGGSLAGRHLTFEPRVREGLFLRDWATGMIDISDGLATDLRHLCEESGAGAIIDAPAVPISPEARRCRGPRSPLEHALRDGEDFELLFTIPARRAVAFKAAWRRRFRLRCTAIGRITREKDRITVAFADGSARRLSAAGFEHFRTP